MTRLIILAIALAITSSTNANDKDNYYYICSYGKFPCADLKEGDLLTQMTAELAVLYCDADKPIISPVGFRNEHWCIYNGLEIREIKYRDADFSGIDRILDGTQ